MLARTCAGRGRRSLGVDILVALQAASSLGVDIQPARRNHLRLIAQVRALVWGLCLCCCRFACAVVVWSLASPRYRPVPYSLFVLLQGTTRTQVMSVTGKMGVSPEGLQQTFSPKEMLVRSIFLGMYFSEISL